MSPLSSVSPLIKVAIFMVLAVDVAVANTYPPLLAILAVLLLLLVVARPGARMVKLLLLVPVMSPSFAVIFSLAGYEEKGAFWPGVVWGMDLLGLYLLRIECIVAANIILVSTTTIREFTQSLRAIGLPNKASLCITIILRFLPLSIEEARRIIDTQRCRGLKPISLLRPKNCLPIFIPLLIAHVKRSRDIALSLEIRHFFWERPRSGRKADPHRSLKLDIVGWGVIALLFIVPYII